MVVFLLRRRLNTAALSLSGDAGAELAAAAVTSSDCVLSVLRARSNIRSSCCAVSKMLHFVDVLEAK